MKIKRILFIGPIPPEIGGNSSGGVASHNWELAQQCTKNNYEVYIYSGQLLRKNIVNNVVLVGKLPGMSGVKHIDISFKIKASMRKIILQSLLNKIEPDIIHFHSLHNGFIDAVDRRMKDKIKIVVTDHAFWNNEKNVFQIQNRFEKVDRVISITKQFKEKTRKYGLEVNDEKVQRIYHPIQSNLFKNIQVKRIQNKIFYSCYSDPIRKGLLEFIRLIQDHDLSMFEFTVTLNSSGINEFKNRFGKIPKYITLYDGLSFDDCLKEYASSKMFLMPSYSEGFAMVFREALLCGTPILGYKPNVEEIQENYSAYIGESYDIEKEPLKKMFDKIIKLMHTQINHQDIIEETKSVFSWESQFAKYHEIYNS
jgi:glycosyltransferase involved in cell wall biosynthesis